MTDWASGYVTDVGYIYEYYPELNPLRAAFALLTAGLKAPTFENACELGFGQGVSVAIHSAVSPTRWYGNDINPTQVEYAGSLVRNSGGAAHLFAQSFAEFVRRSDLPDFDFIGLHGVWTWVSDENRAIIVDFIGRKLRPGGVAYVSYNTQPGWATMVPLRHLMAQHASIAASSGQGTIARIDGAIGFLDRLLATDPIFLQHNPAVQEYFAALKGQDRHYLAHEYFNRDFQTMHFAELAERLMPADLSFGCPAHFLDQFDAANVTSDQQALLREISDPYLRESARDFCVNQRFRRDYWVKQPTTLTPSEQEKALARQRVVLVQPRQSVSFKFPWAIGDVSLREETFRPVLDALSDHRPRSFEQIVQAIGSKNTNLGQVAVAVVIFLGTGALELVQDEESASAARPRTDRLNRVLLEQARSGSGAKTALASPLTGGVDIPRVHALFLLARAVGRAQPSEWTDFAFEVLSDQARKIGGAGKAPEHGKTHRSALESQARDFAANDLPIYQAIGIA